MPPAYFIAGGADSVAEAYPEIYQQLRSAGVSAELCLYAGENHRFGIQPWGKNN